MRVAVRRPCRRRKTWQSAPIDTIAASLMLRILESAVSRSRAGVLAELKEYAQEVDVDFVRKSVACIGAVALRLEVTAQKCVEALLELIKLKVAYVVQEAVVVVRVRTLFICT